MLPVDVGQELELKLGEVRNVGRVVPRPVNRSTSHRDSVCCPLSNPAASPNYASELTMSLHSLRRIAIAFAILGLLVTTARAQQPEPRPLFVEAYADRLSYVPGEEVAIHVSTSAPKYALEIARLGAQRHVVFSKDDLTAGEHPVPENASSHGCGWPVAYRLKIPDDWKSGYYSVTLRVEDRGGPFIQRNRRTAIGEMFFVVRAAKPGATSKILLQLCTNTYNAYTNWGGYSLYAYHGRDKVQGHRVSFDRPLSVQFRNWELPFVAWAESQRLRARLRGQQRPRVPTRRSCRPTSSC